MVSECEKSIGLEPKTVIKDYASEESYIEIASERKDEVAGKI
jgi:hypothetical protein